MHPQLGTWLLQQAISLKRVSEVKHILSITGFKLNEQSAKPPVPLETWTNQAVKSGNVDILQAVLDAGAEIADIGYVCRANKGNNWVYSNALGCAAYHGDLKILTMLLANSNRGINFEAFEKSKANKGQAFMREMDKWTPLMFAISNPSEKTKEILTLLEEHGSNFESQDTYNNTILHIAAAYHSKAAMLFVINRYLSKHQSADIFLPNSKGQTALDICR